MSLGTSGPSIPVVENQHRASSLQSPSLSPPEAASGPAVSPPRQSSPKKTTSRRACDPCSYRRIRCTGALPGSAACDACTKNGLSCTYDRPVRKKGPAGVRITELRELQQGDPRIPQDASTSTTATMQTGPPTSRIEHQPPVDPTMDYTHRPPRMSSPAVGDTSSAWTTEMMSADPAPLYDLFALPQDLPGLPSLPVPSLEWFATSAPPPPPRSATSGSTSSFGAGARSPDFNIPTHDAGAWLPATGHLPPASEASAIQSSLIEEMLHTFFERLHPTIPVFSKLWLQTRIDRGEHYQQRHLRAMLLSMAALTMIQPIESAEHEQKGDRTAQAMELLDEACRERAVLSLGQLPDLDCVMTSFYLFACLFGLQEHQAAWLKLQESISLMQLMNVADSATMATLSLDEQDRRLRAYLILAITERAYALQRHHTLALRGQPGRLVPALLPTVDNDGINFLRSHLQLFDLIDENFVDCWSGCSGVDCRSLTVERALTLQIRLARDLEGVASAEHWFGAQHETRSIQLADLLVTQQWLRNRVWSLCLRHGFIRHDSPTMEMGPQLPLEVGRTALAICNTCSIKTLEPLGIGFAEKLYDISTTLVSILATWPDPPDKPGPAAAARELINQFLAVLAAFRAGSHPYLQPLSQAMGKLAAR